ncbi:DUF1357 family protein (plasmid) [Borrelia coriaceae]|uniref:Uncharacterized protein n=1 Tax=Borrelia coriaceae ATCC 43381 TaxID=1408429 RepID=W5SV59_9SPIR|nr:DUF1357 family protein [Borrelia coriaceae]AHH11104.1 Hypothetical protein BCO_0020700 [Borrelia coriaceae ATCC 43381]UPA17018.1 DUF1357 family protein [Borrelia coriaceae]
MVKADVDVLDELKRDASVNENLSSANSTAKSTTNGDINISDAKASDSDLLAKAVWITRLADDNLSLSYNTQELLSAGHSLVKVLDIQVCELIKKYVDEKQILAVAGSLDVLNLSSNVKDILLRLANANIDSFKNSNNSYSLMTFNKGNLKEVLNLRNTNSVIRDYKDLRQAMINEWTQIRKEFYSA